MKRSSSSGLDKLVHVEEVSAIASNRGDVGMLVRSMGSDWIQKARLLSQTDSGLGDRLPMQQQRLSLVCRGTDTTLPFRLDLRKAQKWWPRNTS